MSLLTFGLALFLFIQETKSCSWVSFPEQEQAPSSEPHALLPLKYCWNLWFWGVVCTLTLLSLNTNMMALPVFQKKADICYPRSKTVTEACHYLYLPEHLAEGHCPTVRCHEGRNLACPWNQQAYFIAWELDRKTMGWCVKDAWAQCLFQNPLILRPQSPFRFCNQQESWILKTSFVGTQTLCLLLDFLSPTLLSL